MRSNIGGPESFIFCAHNPVYCYVIGSLVSDPLHGFYYRGTKAEVSVEGCVEKRLTNLGKTVKWQCQWIQKKEKFKVYMFAFVSLILKEHKLSLYWVMLHDVERIITAYAYVHCTVLVLTCKSVPGYEGRALTVFENIYWRTQIWVSLVIDIVAHELFRFWQLRSLMSR